jgi:endonuclease-3
VENEKEFMRRVCSALEHRFGKRTGLKPEPDAMDLLVQTILSQNTSDRNSEPAFDELKRCFPEWELVLQAPEKEVARAIHRSGFYNLKAKRVKEALAEIKRRRGELNIDFLARESVAEGMNFLTSVKGVGPKTAAVVLAFAFNKPLLAVDVHVYRVARRLGIVPKKFSREKAQEKLNAVVSDSHKLSCHLNLIELGRTVCRPRKPFCSKCPLKRLCAFARRRGFA